MVTKLLILIGAVMLPLIASFFPVNKMMLSTRTCHISTLNVREETKQTVITRGQWWLRFGDEKSHGLFYGRTTFLNSDDAITRTLLSDRSFTFHARLTNRLLETKILNVSRISGDKLSDDEIERWISPALVKGHTNHTMLFRTPGGSILSGLPGRPAIKCDDTALSSLSGQQ